MDLSFRQLIHIRFWKIFSIVGAKEFFQSRIMKFSQIWPELSRLIQMQLWKQWKQVQSVCDMEKFWTFIPKAKACFDGASSIQKGVGDFGFELDLQIVPVALDGLYKGLGKRNELGRFEKVKIKFDVNRLIYNNLSNLKAKKIRKKLRNIWKIQSKNVGRKCEKKVKNLWESKFILFFFFYCAILLLQ